MKKLTILWLDDERDPEVYLKQKSNSGAFLRTSEYYKKNIFSKYDVDFVWCRNFDEFTDYIKKNGLPEFISFDRDLKKGNKIPKGSEYPDGEDCAKWLKDYCRKNGHKLPKYFVHSANKNGQRNIPQIFGDKIMEKKVVLKFNEFINEKYDRVIMDERIMGYVKQIRDGLTEDALDFINYNGYEKILSDEELSKLFHKDFTHDINFTPESDGLCLAFDKNYSEIELLSLDVQCVVWSVKCDIQNIQSIITAAIECLNNCIKLEDMDW